MDNHSPRELTPLLAADLSSFAKALRTQLAARLDSGSGLPGHVEMLNLLARAADRVLRIFDASSRLLRWPNKRHEQVLALWCLWMAFDGKRRYSEREVNQILNAHHAFGDHCLLRRELVESDLLARTPGGEQYRKVAARPDEETAALLRAVRRRAA
jgi:hypothetical protein